MKISNNRFSIFPMFYTVTKHYTKIIICMFILIFLSSKNNKNQPIKALELDINIFL
jgi:hypothetical protein